MKKRALREGATPGDIPDAVIADLVRLGHISDPESFARYLRYGLRWRNDLLDWLSQPVYSRHVINELERIRKSAEVLGDRLGSLLQHKLPRDRKAFEARHLVLLEAEVRGWEIENLVMMLSRLQFAAKEAKLQARAQFRQRGKPNSSGALTRFIERFELCALASGGNWSLNTHARTGTLIQALDIIRDYLPDGLLPKAHPIGTYDKALQSARKEWKADKSPRISRIPK